MANILFLAHRIPYPPNKGDKIRSWHFFQHLAKTHTMHLGFYIDDPKDLKYINMLEGMTASLSYETVTPFSLKTHSLCGFITHDPLSFAAYPKSELRQYVQDCMKENAIDLVFLFSGVTAELLPQDLSVPVVMDLVDVDSDKWAAYSENTRFPLSWIYRREACLLLDKEVSYTQKFSRTLLVSEAEAIVLKGKMKVGLERVEALSNGVDLDAYKPVDESMVIGQRVIFTGAMNYAPNEEAVLWFIKEVWPLVLQHHPAATFRVAGGPLNPRIAAYDGKTGIEVTGYIDNMATEIACAAISVAPMLTARGIQNKVLEAMASGKPVVATKLANEGIEGKDGEALSVADTADDFAKAVIEILSDKALAIKLGNNARSFVEKHFSWETNCAKLDALIEGVISND